VISTEVKNISKTNLTIAYLFSPLFAALLTVLFDWMFTFTDLTIQSENIAYNLHRLIITLISALFFFYIIEILILLPLISYFLKYRKNNLRRKIYISFPLVYWVTYMLSSSISVWNSTGMLPANYLIAKLQFSCFIIIIALFAGLVFTKIAFRSEEHQY